MRLTKLSLRHFRNYDTCDLSFDEGIHLFVGPNAQGKTNLLEAIAYLSTTRSHRTQNDRDLIQEGQEAFVIKAIVTKGRKLIEERLSLSAQGKNLFLNRTAIKRVSDFIGEMNAVLFCPDDMALFQASPRVRRRFIDMELSKLSKAYTRTLNEAARLLKERNACLKQEQVNEAYLQVVSERLIAAEVIIIRQRQHFLQDLLEHCRCFYANLSHDDTFLSFHYHCCVNYSEDEEQLKEQLRLKYEKARMRDQMMKQTTIGIHKEDFMFLINEKEVCSYASQGQKRSVLLALKIGMVAMIHALIHEYPVLLLDDVFSELDEQRRYKLLASLPANVQIFITTTELADIPIVAGRKYSVWKVKQGQVTLAEELKEDESHG